MCTRLLIIMLLLPYFHLSAQRKISEELAVRLKGKGTNFKLTWEEVQKYYSEKKLISKTQDERTRLEKEEKHWARWAWYMEARVAKDGTFVDISKRTHQAILQYEQSNSLNSLLAPVGNWVSMGPSNMALGPTANAIGIGRADRIAFHPTDANTLYVGTSSGGLWKSTNAGASWINLSSYISSLGISGIVVSHADANDIYILTGDGDSDVVVGGLVEGFGYMRPSIGVLKSTDGGNTWLKTGDFGITGQYTGMKLVQDPNNANVLIAATTEGLYRTANGGNTWTRVSENTFTFFDVEFKPGSSSIVYASSTVFWYSDDGGVTWDNSFSTFSPAYGGVNRMQIAVTPANSSIIYVLMGPSWFNDTFIGLYRSANSGTSFSRRSNSPDIFSNQTNGTNGSDQSIYDMALAVSPSNSNTLFTGGINIWKSTDGGTTMENNTQQTTNAGADRFVHADIHDIAYHPLSSVLYAACDGGVFKSSDNGGTWDDVFNGMQAAQYYRMDGTELNSNLLAIGAQDNGSIYRPSNTSTFTSIIRADGFDAAFDPNNAGTFYVSWNSNVSKFTNFATAADNITPASNLPFFANLATHPSNSQVVYAGYNDVYRSDDAGNSWVNTGASGQSCITTCPSNGNRVYAAGPNELYFSSNRGNTWTLISENPGFPETFGKITCVTVNPNNSSQVFITFGGFTENEKVFVSTDTGANWHNISGSLPNVPVNAIAVRANGELYVGNDFGVFFRNGTTGDWSPFYNGLPRVPVTELIISEAAGKLRAATFGRGVFQTDFHSVCPDVLNINIVASGQKYYEAADSITSNANLANGEGTAVAFKAGGSIRLLNLFSAPVGTEFRAFLGACDNGVAFATEQVSFFRNLQEINPDAIDEQASLKQLEGSTGKYLLNIPHDSPASLFITDNTGEIVETIHGRKKFSKGLYLLEINQNKIKNDKYFIVLAADGKEMKIEW